MERESLIATVSGIIGTSVGSLLVFLRIKGKNDLRLDNMELRIKEKVHINACDKDRELFRTEMSYIKKDIEEIKAYIKEVDIKLDKIVYKLAKMNGG